MPKIHRNLASFVSIIFLSILFSIVPLHADASGNGTISVIPASGTIPLNSQFSVDIKIESDTPFNAASATVTTSNNLEIQSLILQNCHFTFVTIPSLTQLNFDGAILGTSSTSCTVYSLTLKAISPGAATINISNGQIKSYDDAQELFSNAANGNYAISTNTIASSPSPTTIEIFPSQITPSPIPTNIPRQTNSCQKFFLVCLIRAWHFHFPIFHFFNL